MVRKSYVIVLFSRQIFTQRGMFQNYTSIVELPIKYPLSSSRLFSFLGKYNTFHELYKHVSIASFDAIIWKTNMKRWAWLLRWYYYITILITWLQSPKFILLKVTICLETPWLYKCKTNALLNKYEIFCNRLSFLSSRRLILWFLNTGPSRHAWASAMWWKLSQNWDEDRADVNQSHERVNRKGAAFISSGCLHWRPAFSCCSVNLSWPKYPMIAARMSSILYAPGFKWLASKSSLLMRGTCSGFALLILEFRSGELMLAWIPTHNFSLSLRNELTAKILQNFSTNLPNSSAW